MNTRVSAFNEDLIANTDDAAAPEEPRGPASRFSVDRMMQSLRDFTTLSEALRILGAAGILASMSVFMLQGWSDGNDISRYLMLLTQTGLLGAAGFAMSHVVKETKGARLFFGLALVSVPANFTILAALLYSVFQWDAGLTTYPGFAEWRIDNIASIGLTVGVAVAVLVPVTLFCFAILARRSAKLLTLHFLLLNALLLLPIRSSMAAGAIALVGLAYLLRVMKQITPQNIALRTGEGQFALATMFIPLGIILFRSMYFYQVDSLMVAMTAMVLFLVARQTSQFPDRSPRLALTLEIASWPLAMVVAFALIEPISDSIASSLTTLVFAASFAALAFDVMRRTSSKALKQAIAISISLTVAISFTLAVAVSSAAIDALFSVAAGVLLMTWGVIGKKQMNIIAGLITAGAGVLFGANAIAQLVMNSSWITLASCGAGAIALASVLDRHGAVIKLRLTHWHESLTKDEQTVARESQD